MSSNNTPQQEDAAVAFLISEATFEQEEGSYLALPVIFRDFLNTWTETKDNDTRRAAARETARRIHADYTDNYLPADPLRRGEDDKGLAGFLTRVYELVFDTARLIDYDDDRQEALMEILFELRNLNLEPARFWSNKQQSIPYKSDPVFLMIGDDRWNGNCPSPPKPQSQTAEPPSPAYQTECTTWVNLSAFLARCEAANFYANCDDRLRYPSIDIELALEKPLPPGILGETRLLVAANWIFHCAGLIHESQVTHDAKGTDSWNTKKWVIWEERLKTELEKARGDGNNNLKLVRALERALRVMSEVVAGSK